jgi:hypothetical protein
VASGVAVYAYLEVHAPGLLAEAASLASAGFVVVVVSSLYRRRVSQNERSWAAAASPG